MGALSDDAIDTMIGCLADCLSPNSDLILEHVYGAVSRVGVADTAFPHRADGYSFLALGQWTDPVAAAYGPNYARLRKLKAKYDPDNFFKQNQNIQPAF